MERSTRTAAAQQRHTIIESRRAQKARVMRCCPGEWQLTFDLHGGPETRIVPIAWHCHNILRHNSLRMLLGGLFMLRRTVWLDGAQQAATMVPGGNNEDATIDDARCLASDDRARHCPRDGARAVDDCRRARAQTAARRTTRERRIDASRARRSRDEKHVAKPRFHGAAHASRGDKRENIFALRQKLCLQ
jgi:hypothetical protein